MCGCMCVLGGDGGWHSAWLQCRLSQTPNEIKCDWRGHVADSGAATEMGQQRQ